MPVHVGCMGDLKNEIDNFAAEAAAAFDLQREGELIGATPNQIEYVRNRILGMNRTNAARAAGYGGDGSTIRSVASKVEKNTKVVRLMALAQANGADMPDLPTDLDARRKVLGRMMHGADKPLAARAIEILAKMDAAGGDGEDQRGPLEILQQIRDANVAVAAILARQFGVGEELIQPQAMAIIDRCIADLKAINITIRKFNPYDRSEAAALGESEALQ